MFVLWSCGFGILIEVEFSNVSFFWERKIGCLVKKKFGLRMNIGWGFGWVGFGYMGGSCGI